MGFFVWKKLKDYRQCLKLTDTVSHIKKNVKNFPSTFVRDTLVTLIHLPNFNHLKKIA